MNADRFEKELNQLWADIVGDRTILRGDAVSDGSSWQDVAGTMAVNLRVLAERLDAARKGRVRGTVHFFTAE